MQLEHLLGIEPLQPQQIKNILDLADYYADQNRINAQNNNALAGCTQVNMLDMQAS